MYQRTDIIGNVGRDIELKYSTGGEAVANFSVACNETWKDAKGEKKERTTWYKISVWGKDAENASRYVGKGSRVFVSGRVDCEAYIDKAGKAQAVLVLRASRIVYLSRPTAEAAAGEESSEAEAAKLPF